MFAFIITIVAMVHVQLYNFMPSNLNNSRDSAADVAAPTNEEKRNKVVELKMLHSRILELQGKLKMTPDLVAAIKRSNDTALLDMDFTPEEYENLEKQLRERIKVLENPDKRQRAALPDFTTIPHVKWFEMPIKYVTRGIANQNVVRAIDEALADLQKKSDQCIRFQKMNTKPSSPHIEFSTKSDMEECAVSGVGRVTKPPYNQIIMKSDCTDTGTIKHEVMHALGYGHTQNRSDRDDYLIMHWDNINPEYAFAFDIWPEAVELKAVPYDYNSIMSYYSTAFANDSSKDTMTPRYDAENIRKTMGFATDLSKIDEDALKKVYC